MFSLICTWTNRTIRRDAGDLRRHHTQCEVIVMHISNVMKISSCRISFPGHQNKFWTYLDSIGLVCLDSIGLVCLLFHSIWTATFKVPRQKLKSCMIRAITKRWEMNCAKLTGMNYFTLIRMMLTPSGSYLETCMKKWRKNVFLDKRFPLTGFNPKKHSIPLDSANIKKLNVKTNSGAKSGKT